MRMRTGGAQPTIPRLGMLLKLLRFYSIHTPDDAIAEVMRKCEDLARQYFAVNSQHELNRQLQAKYGSNLSATELSAAGAAEELEARLLRFYSTHTPADAVESVALKCRSLAREHEARPSELNRKLRAKYNADLSVQRPAPSSSPSSRNRRTEDAPGDGARTAPFDAHADAVGVTKAGVAEGRGGGGEEKAALAAQLAAKDEEVQHLREQSAVLTAQLTAKSAASPEQTPSPGRASDRWGAEAKAAIGALPDTGHVPAKFPCKFAEDFAPAVHGTTLWIPNGLTRSMREEFSLNDGGKWVAEYDYVVHGAAVETAEGEGRTRDKGRSNWRLENFAAIEAARKADLTLSEVAAIRIYTGRWFQEVNAALRQCSAAAVGPWATSISLLISGIIKLSQLTPGDGVVFRTVPCCFPQAASFTGSTVAETFLEHAFMSCSADATFSAEYSGTRQHECLFLVIESTWSSRPAIIAPLSQHPEQVEYIFPPCTSLRFLEIDPLGAKLLVRARAQVCGMRHFTEDLRFPWTSPADPLTAAEYDLIESATRDWGTQAPDAAAEAPAKFSSSQRDLLTGSPKTAALGLEDYMGCDVMEVLSRQPNKFDAVVEEMRTHGTELDKKWLHYVLNEGVSEEDVPGIGIRDRGRAAGLRLAHFEQAAEAQRARLQREHVLALRLYTTPCYISLNAPLRNFKREPGGDAVKLPVEIAEPHRFPVTVFLITEAIKRLRDAEGDKVVTLWRGIKDVRVAEDFLLKGGVEMAPMSTSYALQTALHYSRSRHSIIFKIVTKNFMERGANVEFLSAFPKERECLFPPLTYLSPTGRTQNVGSSVTVIEVTPRL